VRYPLSVLSLILATLLGSCTTVPETGRRQVMLLPRADEAAMGLSAFEEIK